MNNEHYVMISINDLKSKVIAEVLGNKTCKKIMFFLSENNEASEKDLSDNLHTPLNTIEYNIKKLVNSGFVEKKKDFFWSKKGKKIAMYKLSNKSIVISSKRSTSEKLKSILPSIILSLAGAFVIGVYEKISKNYQNILLTSQSYIQNPQNFVAKSALNTELALEELGLQNTFTSSQISDFVISNVVMPKQFLWLYFLAGAFIAIIITSIINWRKL